MIKGAFTKKFTLLPILILCFAIVGCVESHRSRWVVWIRSQTVRIGKSACSSYTCHMVRITGFSGSKFVLSEQPVKNESKISHVKNNAVIFFINYLLGVLHHGFFYLNSPKLPVKSKKNYQFFAFSYQFEGFWGGQIKINPYNYNYKVYKIYSQEYSK